MIRFIQGDLLDAETEAVVNTVNTVGTMGKGIALQFKDAFPDNFKAYAAACKAGDVQVGQMFVTSNDTLTRPKWIINFPTKKHWRNPTKIEWVTEGLRDLRRVITEQGIRSIAGSPSRMRQWGARLGAGSPRDRVGTERIAGGGCGRLRANGRLSEPRQTGGAPNA